MNQWRRYIGGLLGAGVAALVLMAAPAFAETSSSSHYQLTESQFGSGSIDPTCSGSYCAQTSVSSLTIGRSTDGKTTAAFGPLASDQPALEVIVDPGESNLGKLDTSHTATKTMVVRVRSYLSDGYTLQITGSPPRYGSHVLAAPSSPTASTPGKEQFGINAVKNTTPNIGANVAQVPDSGFSFGQVSPSYATPDKFMYKSGDMVASSATESGRTDYTITMILNISNLTPAGHYSGDFSAVVIPVY